LFIGRSSVNADPQHVAENAPTSRIARIDLTQDPVVIQLLQVAALPLQLDPLREEVGKISIIANPIRVFAERPKRRFLLSDIAACLPVRSVIA